MGHHVARWACDDCDWTMHADCDEEPALAWPVERLPLHDCPGAPGPLRGLPKPPDTFRVMRYVDMHTVIPGQNIRITL